MDEQKITSLSALEAIKGIIYVAEINEKGEWELL